MHDCHLCKYSIPGDCIHPKNTSLEFWNRKGNEPCTYFKKKEKKIYQQEIKREIVAEAQSILKGRN